MFRMRCQPLSQPVQLPVAQVVLSRTVYLANVAVLTRKKLRRCLQALMPCKAVSD
jgi:hypothetical protein